MTTCGYVAFLKRSMTMLVAVLLSSPVNGILHDLGYLHGTRYW